MHSDSPDAPGPRLFPTHGHVLVCTGPSCGARGARALFAELWAALERERLAYYTSGGRVRLTESGCLGACAHGPNLAVYRRDAGGALEEAWYAGVDAASARAIAHAVQARTTLPTAGRYDGRTSSQDEP